MRFNYYRLKDFRFKTLLGMLWDGRENENSFSAAIASTVAKSLGKTSLTVGEIAIISPIVNEFYTTIIACFSKDKSNRARQRLAEKTDKTFDLNLQITVDNAVKMINYHTEWHDKVVVSDFREYYISSRMDQSTPFTSTASSYNSSVARLSALDPVSRSANADCRHAFFRVQRTTEGKLARMPSNEGSHTMLYQLRAV